MFSGGNDGPSAFRLSSVLFGDTMVPNIEYDYILLLGYSILYKEYSLTSTTKKSFSFEVVGPRVHLKFHRI